MKISVRSAVALAIVGSAVAAAANQGAQTPTFSSRVDLIPVDVSVTDKQHMAVKGLTAEDFTVTENGVPQKIQAFTAVELAENPPAGVGWVRDVAPDVTSNTGVEEERLVLILLDDGAREFDLAAARSAKEIGHGVIDRLGPRDLAAVVDVTNYKNNQEFTHDVARLHAAVDRFNPLLPVIGAIETLEVAQRALTVLSSVQKRRKTVVWITAGYPIPVAPDDAGLYYMWRDLLTAARLGNVNLFPIDPTGLRADPSFGQASAPAAGGTGPESFQTTLNRTAGTDRLKRLRDSLHEGAAQTGGHAFTSWNEFKSSVAQVFREAGSFYVLGYASTNTALDGKFRKIQVKVNRPGVTVTTGSGYYGQAPPNARRVTAPAPPPASVAAITGLIPQRAVPLHLFSAPFATTGMPAVVVAIGLPAPPGTGADDVDVILDAFTFDGTLKATKRIQAHLAPSPNARASDHQVLACVDLPPGRYQLRAGVTSAGRAASGSVYADLDVPDFAKDAVSLSGVVLVPTPPAVAAPANALAGLLSVAPTTDRIFTATDHIDGLVRIYQGGAGTRQAVTLATTIRSEKNASVFAKSDTIESSQFDAVGSSADSRFTLPLATLPAGEYVLTIEATLAKGTASRAVRFRVK